MPGRRLRGVEGVGVRGQQAGGTVDGQSHRETRNRTVSRGS